MNCPSPEVWRALLAHRFEATGREPAELQPALAHLESCPACRRLALAIDPSLLFQSLRDAEPALAASADVEAMRQAVASLRRTSERRQPRRAVGKWLLRAAGIVGLAVLLSQVQGLRPSAGPAEPVTVAALASVPSAAVAAAEPESLPLVEGTDHPDARVYELGGRDLAVVMIVDQSLDV